MHDRTSTNKKRGIRWATLAVGASLFVVAGLTPSAAAFSVIDDTGLLACDEAETDDGCSLLAGCDNDTRIYGEGWVSTHFGEYSAVGSWIDGCGGWGNDDHLEATFDLGSAHIDELGKWPPDAGSCQIKDPHGETTAAVWGDVDPDESGGAKMVTFVCQDNSSDEPILQGFLKEPDVYVL